MSCSFVFDQSAETPVATMLDHLIYDRAVVRQALPLSVDRQKDNILLFTVGGREVAFVAVRG